MTFRINYSHKRRAAVAPIAALLMGFMVGMLAFSIDIGYICSVQAELQDAADAAALAAAQQLQNPFVAYYSPGQTQQQQIYLTVTTDTSNSSSPIPTAQRFALYNQAGGAYIRVQSSDVSFDYYDGTTFQTPSYASNLFPNTVTVTTRRDSNANGSLGLFFASVFGISSIDLTATASATMYAGDVTSQNPIQNAETAMIPVGLDIYTWVAFASGNFTFLNGNFSSPSAYLSSSNVTIGPNGLAQLQVYPAPTNTPGSFGLIDIGVPSNNTPAFRSWIDDGQTPNDITYLLNNSLLPVSSSNPEPWKVGPGLKSTLVSNFQSIMGVPSLIPLFVPVSPLPNYVAASGNGQNATYAVVGFAGVTITQADGNGNNMNISIQPSAIVPTNAVINNAKPAGTQQSQFQTPLTTFVSAKLTR
ncbi:MAG TPA: pilus assembly protein TadG-related protein [Gemmataceae bacterium]|jgi:Flp pilus assembly protein TadG